MTPHSEESHKSSSRSRRAILRLGGAALIGSLAGCAEVLNPAANEDPESTDGPSRRANLSVSETNTPEDAFAVAISQLEEQRAILTDLLTTAHTPSAFESVAIPTDDLQATHAEIEAGIDRASGNIGNETDTVIESLDELLKFHQALIDYLKAIQAVYTKISSIDTVLNEGERGKASTKIAGLQEAETLPGFVDGAERVELTYQLVDTDTIPAPAAFETRPPAETLPLRALGARTLMARFTTDQQFLSAVNEYETVTDEIDSDTDLSHQPDALKERFIEFSISYDNFARDYLPTEIKNSIIRLEDTATAYANALKDYNQARIARNHGNREEYEQYIQDAHRRFTPPIYQLHRRK